MIVTEGQARAQLLLPLRNRRAFVAAYFSKRQAGDDGGGLFVAGELDVELGDEVDVELQFTEEQVRFHIRARVVWKRAQPGRRALPQGIGIEFLETEVRTQQQILRFAEGRESVNHVDRERRWRLNVDVTLAHQGHDLTGVTDDLSEGGCFVIAHQYSLLPVGTVVAVRLRAPGSLFGWMTLPAHVTWLRQQPGRHGMGLEFRFDSDRQRNKIKKIVRVHRERLLRDVTVKVPRSASTPPTER